MITFKGFNFEKAVARLHIYTGIFIPDLWRETLLRRFPPLHRNVYADHVTLFFRPDQAAIDRIQELKKTRNARFRVVSYAADEKGQAIGVALFPKDIEIDRVYVESKIMHITISCADDIPPVYSNELMFRARPLSMDEQFSMYGEYGVCSHTDRNHLPQEVWKRRGL